MRKIAIALVATLLAVALHATVMSLWHEGHSMPFHSGQAMLTCPMGYVCPVSPAALRLALASPSPEGFRALVPTLLAAFAVLLAYAIFRRYEPPPLIATSTSPSGLRSTFKKE